VDFKLARRYGGPALFWKDFRQISGTVTSPRNGDLVSSITSNPKDCLAFATAGQVLTAALMSAGNRGDEDQIEDIASRFRIADQVTQPIRTLSGGESVKLALAKTYVSIPSCDKVVISSPFAWLSSANRYLLEDVIEQCYHDRKKVSILALDGEDDLSPATVDDLGFRSRQTVLSFSMQMSDVRIPLTLSLNPLADHVPRAAIDDTSLKLESPCLITGENGQGKSLLARALAGSIALQGRAVVGGVDTQGKVSLLFQDVQTQTLMRSFSVLAAGGRNTSKSSVLSIYTDIREAYNLSLVCTGAGAGPFINEPGEKGHTLLDVKAILVAVRIAASPAALILDEPDWGLSRQSSITFVDTVVTIAHDRKIPVLLISHKPCWQPLIRSCLSVSRTPGGNATSSDEPVFTVYLDAGEVGQ
jgi:energy-coupling factor transporter ATP-binding protein EcfA2